MIWQQQLLFSSWEKLDRGHQQLAIEEQIMLWQRQLLFASLLSEENRLFGKPNIDAASICNLHILNPIIPFEMLSKLNASASLFCVHLRLRGRRRGRGRRGRGRRGRGRRRMHRLWCGNRQCQKCDFLKSRPQSGIFDVVCNSKH